jgi:hypothetical protein
MNEVVGIGMVVGFFAVMYGPAVYAFKTKHPHKWGMLGISLLLPFLGGIASMMFLVASAPVDAMTEGTPRFECPNCQRDYFPADYNPSMSQWLCDGCGSELPRATQAVAADVLSRRRSRPW